MNATHKIVLTAAEVRSAIYEYLSIKGENFPTDASMRCRTQRTFKEASDDPEVNLIEIEWGVYEDQTCGFDQINEKSEPPPNTKIRTL